MLLRVSRPWTNCLKIVHGRETPSNNEHVLIFHKYIRSIFRDIEHSFQVNCYLLYYTIYMIWWHTSLLINVYFRFNDWKWRLLQFQFIDCLVAIAVVDIQYSTLNRLEGHGPTLAVNGNNTNVLNFLVSRIACFCQWLIVLPSILDQPWFSNEKIFPSLPK